jgi:hypothetical protein
MKPDDGCSRRMSPRRFVVCTIFAVLTLHAAKAVANEICEEAERACEVAEEGKRACGASAMATGEVRRICTEDKTPPAVCATDARYENARCSAIAARQPVCGAGQQAGEAVCDADVNRRAACAALTVTTDVCEIGKARRDLCDAVETLKACADLKANTTACEDAKRTCPESPKYRKPDSLLLGLQVSDAAQIRIPQLDGLPAALFVNLLGVGALLQKEHVELLFQGHLMDSSTTVAVQVPNASASQEQHAKGIGGDVGVRVAVGWFDALSGGFYFSAYPAYSVWNLNATFDSKTSYNARVTEVSADFGFGYKVRLNDHFRFDILASAVHVGVRPEAKGIVNLTSYPTLGFGLDGVCWP